MNLNRPTIFFFRSLDTAGNDFIKVGPFPLGSFSKHFEEEFRNSELDFVPVLGMGGGPLLEQAEYAKEFLRNHAAFKENQPNIHFFGHSAGGLVAKAVAKDTYFQKNLKSLITLGTPHRGSLAAKWAAEVALSNPKFASICRALNYDLTLKRPTFESFQELAEENFDFPNHILTGSIVCAPPPEKWSSLLRLAHRFLVIKDFNEPSDGLIEKSSQVFGHHQWEFNLDHIQQIGFGGQKAEFQRMCQHLEKLWLELF